MKKILKYFIVCIFIVTDCACCCSILCVHGHKKLLYFAHTQFSIWVCIICDDISSGGDVTFDWAALSGFTLCYVQSYCHQQRKGWAGGCCPIIEPSLLVYMSLVRDWWYSWLVLVGSLAALLLLCPGGSSLSPGERWRLRGDGEFSLII